MQYLNSAISTISKFFSSLLLVFGSIHFFLNALNSNIYTPEETIKYVIAHPVFWAVSIIATVIVLTIINWLFTKIKIFLIGNNPFQRKIQSYRKDLSEGKYYELKSQFEKRKPWILFRKYNFQFELILAKLYLMISDYKQSYNSLQNANKLSNSNSQLLETLKIKLELFGLAGYTNGAEIVISEITELTGKSELMVHQYKSIILERQGKFDDARTYLINSLTGFEKDNSDRIIAIYNNLGRIEGIFRNETNKLHYYEKAKSRVKKLGGKNYVHIVYPNLIDTHLILKNYKEAQNLLEEYSNMINPSIENDLLQYHNYLLTYYRQKDDISGIKNVINLNNEKLKPSLSEYEKLVYDINELGIYFDSNLDYVPKLKELKNKIHLTESFAFHEKFKFFKKLFTSMSQISDKEIQGEFTDLFSMVINFLKDSFSKIDSFLIENLEDFMIYERCQYLNDKVMISRLFIKEYNSPFEFLKQKLNLIEQIIDTYKSTGNAIESYDATLNYLDEGINSFQFGLSESEKKVIRNLLIEHLMSVKEPIGNLKNHPACVPFYLRLSRYALFLGYYEISKDYFKKFLEFNVNINHFKKSLQRYHDELQHYHNL